MKSEKHSKIRSAAKYVRIDPYTWIEKRINESDEVARQRFLNKLARAVNDSHLQPGFNA